MVLATANHLDPAGARSNSRSVDKNWTQFDCKTDPDDSNTAETSRYTRLHQSTRFEASPQVRGGLVGREGASRTPTTRATGQGVRGSNPLSSTERTGQLPCPNLGRGAGHGHWTSIGHLWGVPGPETARYRVVSTSLGGPRPPRCHGHHTPHAHTRPDALEPVFTIAGLATELSAPIGANPRSRSRGMAASCCHVPNGTLAHELE